MSGLQQQLSPLVYWAQTEKQITLKVDLKDVKKPDINITDCNIKFLANGLGARGVNAYNFVLDFYGTIDNLESTYKAYDSKIDVILKKAESSWWPRLTAQPQKPHWLKIDFDRWHSEDDVEEDTTRDIMQDYPGMYDKLQKEEYGYIKEQGKKVYMIFYNLAQFIGFLYILCVITILYYRDGPAVMARTFETVGNAMKFCQLMQYLEVMHPMFGYTKGSVLMPFLQVTARNFVLFVMIDCEERMQVKPVIFYLFLIWSVIEIVRYPYYISTLINKPLRLLTWLRYTLWIPLYPMGTICEGIIILRNIPYFEETKRFTIELPNRWNFMFCMPTFMKIYLLILILPGIYLLMTHMAKARAKKLAGRKLNIE